MTKQIDWSRFKPSPLNTSWEIRDRDAGSVMYTPWRKRIAIVGANYCIELRSDILNDPSWEVWSCNMMVMPCLDTNGLLRADRWFELHQLKAQNEMDWSWIRACPVPMYMAELPDRLNFPRTVKFPIENVIKQGRSYFHCTFALQVAYALSLGYVEEIGLFGVNLPVGSRRERTLERASVEYWIGIAEGRGVKVTIPIIDKVALLHSPFIYGFDYHEEAAWVRVQMEALVGIAHA